MRRIPIIVLTVVALLFAMSALAQSTTATVHGRVTNASGANLANAEVNAVNTSSGFVQTVKAGADGTFQMSLPPGTYNLVVAASGYEPLTENITVLVGQNLPLDVRMATTATISESITVVGNQAVETRTSEAATNITRQQIENLPQPERNFLNFAALAPGIRTTNDPQRKTIAGDAQPAEQTNVYIDGISFKNDVLQGGVVGQDASGGNPFPQNAVQEFRVITQNFSAQYGQASSAIITAVTRSGGNQIDGNAFVFYQPHAWVSATPKNFQYNSLTSNKDYQRIQPGIAIGGPIVRDKLHFFVSYEGDNQQATTTVTVPSQYTSQFGQYNGTFDSPFRSNLGFGKVSWQPLSNQMVEFTGNYRTEYDIRDFGGQTSYEAATKQKNDVYGATVRHQWTGSSTLNQASISWQTYQWHPTSLNPTLVGRDYQGAVRIGGKDTTQDFKQRRIDLRDDYNFAPFQAAGDHSFQVGGNVDFMHYDVTKFQNGNPVFRYRIDPANGYSYDFPFQVDYGFGNPTMKAGNNEYGIYGQDTWAVNPKLTLNLGLRWDYESNQIDTGYVTPANIVAGLTGKVDPSYFSNGSNRSQFKGAIQPRLGFSYDLQGNGRSVVYGGAGRYYDRIFFNSTFDERFRLQWPQYHVAFSADGRPGTVKWDPKYYDVANLNALIATGENPPEIFLINNNLKPPYSDQFSLGYRQALGQYMGSISYNGVRGYRGLTYVSATGICCSALVPGYGNVILSDPNGKKYWYDAMHLTIEKPFVGGSRWGGTLAWTHATAEQTGNDLFSLDLPSAAAYGRHAVPGSEKDRLVISAIVGLPWEVRFSTIGSFGSGAAFNVLDFSQGFSLENRLQTHPFKRSIYPDKTMGPFADRNIDLRLEKAIGLGHTQLALIGEVFNAFNWANYGCLDNFISPGGNPNLGNPGCVTNLGRRYQAGFRVGF